MCVTDASRCRLNFFLTSLSAMFRSAAVRIVSTVEKRIYKISKWVFLVFDRWLGRLKLRLVWWCIQIENSCLWKCAERILSTFECFKGWSIRRVLAQKLQCQHLLVIAPLFNRCHFHPNQIPKLIQLSQNLQWLVIFYDARCVHSQIQAAIYIVFSVVFDKS